MASECRLRFRVLVPTVMSQPEHIENVPAEIWIKILVDVEPFDVLSAGKTCRYLRDITSSKDLWRGLVNTMCSKHGLFRPSYPVEDMSLGQIQRATVGPYLFARQLQHRGASFDTPIAAVDRLEPVSQRIACVQRHILFYQLVPGGRFAVFIYPTETSTETIGTLPALSMELVDLGPPGLPLSPEPALSYVHPNISSMARGGMMVTASVSITSQSPLADTLRVGIAMIHTDGSYVVSIFAITPTHSVPSFERLASFTIMNRIPTENIHSILVHGDRALLIIGNIFIAWSFTEETCIVIHHNTILAEDEIICIAASGVYQWSLSDKKNESIPTSKGVFLEKLPPLRSSDTVIEPPWDRVAYHIQITKRGNNKLPFTFDVFLVPRAGGTVAEVAIGRRYTLRSPQKTSQNSIVRTPQPPVCELTLDLEHSFEVSLGYLIPSESSPSPYLYPGLSTLSSGVGRASYVDLIYWIQPRITADTEHAEAVEGYTGTMKFLAFRHQFLLSWCPASSRCLFPHDHIAPSGRTGLIAIEVYDYVT
ncbi:hypothetical protein D9611_013070 [Ephemerocybe angulata]|uniref:F-box domain-containing protein n=1 Tax=Ephemerocybe angulata TaxID=980116 RepID=A0A8H5BXW1_9AGAR|nr:hypothetical protein D9611_013070 [Tulosesus angulatus]